MTALSETELSDNVEQTRAAVYGLLARLLYAAPDQALLEAMANADDIIAEPSQAAFAKAWQALRLGSQVADAEALEDEYARLFLGLGKSEVVPYMSWHMTGFLMEEPLARLRDALAVLGLARVQQASEPEDHMAAILEVMRFMIVGDEDTDPAALTRQTTFFKDFIQPWYIACAAQIETAQAANYYRLVARIMRAFLDMEAQAFELEP
jgi:TorA maturation chaperone TorD